MATGDGTAGTGRTLRSLGLAAPQGASHAITDFMWWLAELGL